MIVEHVIRNAQEATRDGWLGDRQRGRWTAARRHRRELADDGGRAGRRHASRLRVPMAALTVSDTGAGMTREFVQERLFKPFDTTKGSKGMGIGAYQVREYVQSLGGRVDVASDAGPGTRFTLLHAARRIGEIGCPANRRLPQFPCRCAGTDFHDIPLTLRPPHCSGCATVKYSRSTVQGQTRRKAGTQSLRSSGVTRHG